MIIPPGRVYSGRWLVVVTGEHELGLLELIEILGVDISPPTGTIHSVIFAGTQALLTPLEIRPYIWKVGAELPLSVEFWFPSGQIVRKENPLIASRYRESSNLIARNE